MQLSRNINMARSIMAFLNEYKLGIKTARCKPSVSRDYVFWNLIKMNC